MRSLGPILLCLVLASAASAGEIEIQFDFSATTISAAGGLINIPPDGSVSAASATLRVPGSGSATASAGSGSLSLFTLNIGVNAITLGVNITGNLVASQLGTATGSLTAGLAQVNLGGSPMQLYVTGLLNCFGPMLVCDGIGTFPATLTGTQTLPPPFQLGLGGVNTPGSASLTGTTFVTIGGQSAIVSLVGTEVSRTYVPEPGGAAQLAAGLSALGLLALRRRRR